MATNINADRMRDNVSALGRITWEPWINLPEDLMRRFPSMRDWNSRMKLRDENHRGKIDEELARLQQALP